MKKIRVLVVDDSAFMRKVIPEMIQEDGEIEVIDTAKDGREALKKTLELKPDVVTLDVEMPEMDGLEAVAHIMSQKPTPIVMLSAHTKRGADITIKSLEYGAVDFVCKPSGSISLDIKKVQQELIEKIKAAKTVDASALTVINPEDAEPVAKEKAAEGLENKVMVVIASSTGGPRALSEIIPKISRFLPASFLVVQHMSPGFTKSLADRLNRQSLITVKEAEDGDEIKAGNVYLAPGNYHMEVVNRAGDYAISLNQKPARHGVRPCADLTMFSAAKVFDGKIIGVILTGMGKDGAAGAEKIKEKKGTIIAQDKGSCVIYGMPKIAVDKGIVDSVVSINVMSNTIELEINRAIEAIK